MKILVESSKLAKACALANKNIPGKTTLPIIQNLHIAAEGDMLKVSSTDTETWVVYNVPATVEYDDVPASFCLDASNITSLLQAIPSQPVTIEIQENKAAARENVYYAKITHSCGTSELPVQNADEYPSLCPITNEGHTIPAEVLKKSIQTCRFSLYTDAEAKPNLASVCLDFIGNSMVAVASDGNTLARLVHKDMVGEKCQYLVPAKAMSLLVPVLDDVLKAKEAMDIVIRKNSNIICMQTDSVSIYYCQTTLRYPNYDSVIPPVKNVRYEAVMNRQDLISAITRASLFTSAESMRLIFRFDGTKEYVSVTGNCIDFATSSEEKVKCEFSTSDRFNIAFKATSLKNVLLHLSTEQVKFNLIEKYRAVTIVEENGNPGILMLIMPMFMEDA